jgi:catechol 2,3-dioxygenase-like lactoylglutathione lyase family enzyme
MTPFAHALTFVLLTAAGPTPAPGAFFALSVDNVNVQARWYQDKLGFRVLSQGEAPNGIAKFAILEGRGALVELIQHRDAKPLAVAAPNAKGAFQVHGIFKVGLIVKDIDAVYKELKTLAVPIAYDLMPAKDVPMRSFSIRDAEGNMIQFFGQ